MPLFQMVMLIIKRQNSNLMAHRVNFPYYVKIISLSRLHLKLTVIINIPLPVAMQASSATHNNTAGSSPKPVVIIGLSLSVLE